MMMGLLPRATAAGTALLLVLLATACGDSTGPEDPRVGSILIHAPDSVLDVGSTVQLTATVLDPTGAVLSGLSVEWSSEHPDVASVSTAGVLTAVAPGITRIEARSGEGFGSLAVAVSAGPCVPASVEGTLSAGQVATDSLQASDCVLLEGPYADGWEFELEEQALLDLELSSDDFDAVLVITDLEMQFLAFDDDGGEGTDARLRGTAPAGRYIVWATSFAPGETGAFRLSMEVEEFVRCSEPVGTLEIGSDVVDELDEESCFSDLVGSSDPWRFAPDEAVSVRIDMTSGEFDTFLLLTDEDGEVVAFDDDGGGELNSRIEVDLAPGEYTVWAASFSGSATGSYRIVVQEAAAGATARPFTAPEAPPVSGRLLHPRPSKEVKSTSTPPPGSSRAGPASPWARR